MAARKRKKLFYNCIWTLLLTVLLALPTLGVMDLSTLALEQETRCGQQEHTHVPECYFRDMLMCDQKAHSHSENCYLVLLEDNDINWLLSAIEDTEEKSLENVIDSAMVQALNLNPNLTSVNSQQIHLAADNIQELNTVIAENDIQPAVVLNENIRDNYLSYIPPQPEPEEEATEPAETTSAATTPSGGAGTFVPVQTTPPTILATEPTTTETTEPTVTTEATEPTIETTEATEPTTATEATEPPATTEATQPPATTEATEPPATTESTQPPATTEATQPPATTEATQPPASTEATQPPASTEATEPPATTEATQPPATTEATQPPATTEATQPPASTEATEPPATTEATQPPATTEATQPPATTEATQPPATTEATQPPATTEATEPPATTEATEPPSTTEATEPTDPTEETDPTDPTEETEPETEPLYLWQYGQEVTFMPERPAEYGELALYLYNKDHWVCVDNLKMTQIRREEKNYYSVSLEQIHSTYAQNLLSDGAVPGGTLYYAPQSPAMGIDNIAQVNTDTLDFGTDGSVRHVYLTDTYFNKEEQLVYQPVSFCNVTLDYTNVDPELETEKGFVRSGTSFEAILPESYLWLPNPDNALPETDAITADVSLYALPLTKEEQVDMVLGTSSPEAAATVPVLGGGPDSGNNKVHFYFLLDGQIVFLNSGNVQTPNWGGKYCSYSEAVNAYTSENPIITGLTTGNLGSRYWFYHNSSGNLTGTLTAATSFWQNLYFANTSGAQHAILSYGNGNSYSAVNFYTVKLDYSAVSGTDQVQYVENGMNSTLSLDDNYLWYRDQAHTIPATAENLKNIRSTTTLYAAHKTRTVTFVTNGGSTMNPQIVSHGGTLTLTEETKKEGYLLEGWYTDEALTQRFDFATPITENLTLYAHWSLPCNVSFLDAEDNPIQEPIVIAAGSELTLPPYYEWKTEDGQTFQGGQTVTITADTVFTGSIYTYTVTFHHLDGTEYAVLEKIPHGSVIQLPADPVSDKYTFDGWFTDEAYSQEFDQTQPIVSDLELFSRWGFEVTLHYLDLEGNPKNQETATYRSGETITLPDHFTWKDLGIDPDDPADDKIYSGGDTLTLNRSMTLFGNPDRYTVSFVNPDSTAAAEPIILTYGGNFLFPAPPEGCVWEGSDGSHYIEEDYFDEVSSDLTFTAVEVTITLRYNVNFPADAANRVDKVPTLYGTTSATATDTVPGGTSATVRSLTSNTARREINSGNKESNTYYFKGWKIQGQDALIPPDSALTWRQLAQYADANGNIQLTGQWEAGEATNSVTFFVRFDSVATDTEGNIGSHPTTDYTHEIFNTYLGGVPDNLNSNQLKQQYDIADTTADNSFTVDQEIRALYGERPEGIWMYDFPLDNNIFAQLKEYLSDHPNQKLTVDGETVKSEELNSTHYAIRWYVFKLEGSSWHVDGKLVRREGVIKIYKHFRGEEEAITKAEQGFYIVAQNGTLDASGKFNAYNSTNSHFKQYVLTLTAPPQDLRDSYRYATFQLVNESQAHNDYWEITDVALGELWQITEYVDADLSSYSHYAEYSIFDSDGGKTAIAEYGTQASVTGKTFALDEDPNQGLTVEFTNYYFKSQSILLKKEDATTGAGIGGAGFHFIQRDNKLTFTSTPDKPGYYTHKSDAADQIILTAASGYATIDGFSYQYGIVDPDDKLNRGIITIQEAVVPEGYGQAPTISLGLDQNDNVFISSVTVGNNDLPQEDWDDYVELPRNDILIIKNHVTDRISVTARKQWNTNAPADRVQVVLQANGDNAANVFPGLTNAQAELSASNGWTHTWTGLPRYAGGQPVAWSIKEVMVGNAPTLSDGVSFANWIPSYISDIPTDTDGDGKPDNWAFTVINHSKTPKLILTKVGAADEPLSGAIFTLEQVELGSNGWQRVRGSVPVSQTTGSNGQLTFDNLTGTYTYRLTEVKAPENYIILIDPVIFTIDGMGTIQKLDDSGNPVPFEGEFLKHGDKFNLTVRNLIAVEMPETGGRGIGTYWLFGIALMMTALMLYRLPARKEEGPFF